MENKQRQNTKKKHFSARWVLIFACALILCVMVTFSMTMAYFGGVSNGLKAEFQLKSGINLKGKSGSDYQKMTIDGGYMIPGTTISSFCLVTIESGIDKDGNFDENDRYGYLMTSNYYIESNWVYASGLTIASIEDGEISLDNVMSERMIKTAEIMYDLVKVGNHTFIPSGTFNPGDTDSKMFIDGKALFHETTTTLVIYLRNASLDFGIVPLPKYDETQEDYYSMATTQMMMVPSTLADPDFTGLMLESLAMESHRLVRPAVYETSFSEKYLRDEDSFEMYNIIRDSGVYDFNWNFGDGNAFSSIMATLVRNGTPEKLASFYASNEKSVMRKLTKVLELIQGS